VPVGEKRPAAVVHHSVTALGASQKAGVAAALLLGHLEAGARPRPAETIEDRPERACRALSARAPGSSEAVAQTGAVRPV